MYYTKSDIITMISDYLYDKYSFIPNIRPETNWYTDLKLTDWDKYDFYAWAEEKFAIKVSTYFSTIDALASDIYNRLQKKYKQQQPSLFQRIKQKFTQHTK